MSTQECLDAYEIVQGLVTHPGLKPHQRRQAEALLKDIKANLENSDDEGETSRPDDQQMGPAQTPPRPTPAISAAPRQTQAAAIRTKAHQFPPRESAHSEKPGAQRDLGLPHPIGQPHTQPPSFAQFAGALATEGDQFLASITASQNTHMSPPTAPALDTRPPQAPRPEPNSRPPKLLTPIWGHLYPHALVNLTSTSQPSVRLNTALTTTDDGDNSDQPPARPPVPVVLDHGLGHTRPFQCDPRQPPAHRLPGTEFMTQDMFRNYTIPRDRTQGPSANAQQEQPKDRSGGTSAHSTVARSARSPSVELFVSGQLLPMQEVNRWNTELSTGISWTIESAEKSLKNIVFILDTLPQMISSHPPISREKSPNLWSDIGHLHQLCVSGKGFLASNYVMHPTKTDKKSPSSENILKVAGSLSLITPDMVDMGKITTKAPGKDGHILAPNLANFFAPPKVAYTRLKSTLEQSWSTLHFSDVKNQWFQQAFDDKNGVYLAYAHFCQSYENLGTTPSAPNTDDVSRSAMDLVQTFCGAMAGLAYICTKSDMRPKQAKLDRARTTHHTEHVQMLANLLIFGPTAAFTSLRKSQFVSLANANAMLELGSSVLKQKLALGISAPMPHSTFDNLRLHFLNFLVRMGFTQLDKDGVPNVDWKQVHKAFYNDFSPLVVSQLVSQDVEIALEHRLG
ncbi:hypothetical protein KEM48_002880 [Puccinia striiformis f. sp. tritici PST-130]|nr:hypothetical protein KEM48_002880 [Puccinia striiformis f. sp. tritici PST-130]